MKIDGLTTYTVLDRCGSNIFTHRGGRSAHCERGLSDTFDNQFIQSDSHSRQVKIRQV